MTSKETHVLELARQISRLTEPLVQYLEKNQLPDPNYGPTYRAPETLEYEAFLAPLNEATQDFTRLVNGPKRSLTSLLITHYDLAAYQVALEFGFFEAVPIGPGESINLKDLAEAVNIDEDRTGRIMKFLATQRVFEEVDTDVFQHTSSSALFALDEELKAAALMQLDEMFRAASETSTCIAKAPYHSDSVDSPFHARFGVPVFQYYAQNPLKAARFARAMAGVSQVNRQISELRDKFDWKSQRNGKVVDIGGGSGHVSIALARQYPDVEFVVQDISPAMLAQGQNRDLSDLHGRVTFQQHDFFAPQPIHDATAFFIRQCLHNQTDEGVLKILRALIPALKHKPKIPVVINETILPERGAMGRAEEHDLRQMDLLMLVVLGAKQRTEKEFRTLVKEADPRFEVVHIHNEGKLGLLEIHFNHTEETVNGENGVH